MTLAIDGPPVDGLHLPSGSDASTEVVVSWHRRAPVDKPRVDFGTPHDGLGRLVAAGARNQKIADQLGVSINTIETHLTHIYEKTCRRGRAALAAW